MLTFGQQLVGLEDDSVIVLNPSTHTWLEVGSWPELVIFYVASVVLPTREMVALVISD